MREIKFRAFDDGEMLYEKDLSDINKTPIYRIAQFWCNIRPDSIVMQYTGLQDKNGKDIYEGDILGFWDIDETNYQKFIDDNFPDFDTWDGKKIYKKSQMKWSNDAYGWRIPMQSRLKISMNNVEVIGNIYQNPELLNQ